MGVKKSGYYLITKRELINILNEEGTYMTVGDLYWSLFFRGFKVSRNWIKKTVRKLVEEGVINHHKLRYDYYYTVLRKERESYELV